MKYRRLGRSGLQVSEVILGSWLTFGSRVEAAATEECVKTALDLGIQTIDTADVYARGEAERVLGRAIRSITRSDLVLASKCFWPMSDKPNDRGLSRKHVTESVEASLGRLGTDYLDLYQCHRFDPDVPLEETVRALEDMVRQGKLLYWGVSCWTGAQIREGLEIARAAGGYGPVSNQPPYSLMERDIETEVVPVSRELGVGQIVFSPLAQGVLTGKYAGGRMPPESRAADEKRNVFMKRYLEPEHAGKVEAFVALARELSTTAGKLALAWCLARPTVDAVIVGATHPEQVTENAGAVDLELDEDTVRRLDELFPVT